MKAFERLRNGMREAWKCMLFPMKVMFAGRTNQAFELLEVDDDDDEIVEFE